MTSPRNMALRLLAGAKVTASVGSVQLRQSRDYENGLVVRFTTEIGLDQAVKITGTRYFSTWFSHDHSLTIVWDKRNRVWKLNLSCTLLYDDDWEGFSQATGWGKVNAYDTRRGSWGFVFEVDVLDARYQLEVTPEEATTG